MSMLLFIISMLLLLSFVGLLIYTIFARGRRKKVFGLSVLAFVGSVTLANIGGNMDDEEERLERGFASVNDMQAADRLDLETVEEYQAHLKIKKVEAEKEARIAAEKAKLAAAEEKRKEAECPTNLNCWAKKHSLDASVVCERMVERLAKFDFEWTDSWTELKFPRFRWANKKKGVVTYFGDKIKLQNGFGAWQHYVYACDYDPRSGKVVNVDGAPGRL